ncbi:hypothetical protein ACFV27_00960 [Streptomyces antimycoticus]|uniref:hypothetical protein n=1 Tax=Streptomyces antimycoticus TaxID=68175 RepID=UPI0036CF0DF3
MSPDEIHIEPAPEQRVAFARWGVAQAPKVRTVGVSTFAVAPELFVQAPEEILIGALVDGHRYVSPEEDATNGTPPPGAELLGVATEEGFAAAGGDSSVPAFAPLDDAPADEDEGQVQDGDGTRTLYGCPLCPRDFETERGRDTHRRQAHRED